MIGTKLTRDHHLWTRDTIKNVTGDVTLDLAGDLTIDADGGQVAIKDAGSNQFLFDCDNTKLTIYDDTNDADLFAIQVSVTGDTTISTDYASAGGANADMTLAPDGDLYLSPVAGDVSGDINNFYFESDSDYGPQLVLKNTKNSSTNSTLLFWKDRGAGSSDDDKLGYISFYGGNAADQFSYWCHIICTIETAADGDEGGKLDFQVASHNGTMTSGLSIVDGSASGEIDVNIGAGTDSVTTIAGDLDIDGDTITSAGDLTINPSGGDINIPANIGLTFGDDGEKIEGDGTNLTITSGNRIALTAGGVLTSADLIVTGRLYPYDAGGEYIEGDGSDLTITASRDISFAGARLITFASHTGEIFFGSSTAGFLAQTGTDAVSIDWGEGNKYHLSLNNSSTVTFATNPLNPCNLLLYIRQLNGGSKTITWAVTSGTIYWAGGGILNTDEPTLTTTDDKTDILSFYWDGTNYFGVASLNFDTT